MVRVFDQYRTVAQSFGFWSPCSCKRTAPTAYWHALKSDIYGRFAFCRAETSGEVKLTFNISKASSWSGVLYASQYTPDLLFNKYPRGWAILEKLFDEPTIYFEYLFQISHVPLIYSNVRLVRDYCFSLFALRTNVIVAFTDGWNKSV